MTLILLSRHVALSHPPRQTQERQLKLREKVTQMIYQKRLHRDQFLREVYAGEGEEAEQEEEEEEEEGDGKEGNANTTKKSNKLLGNVRDKADSGHDALTRLPVLSPDHNHGHAPHIHKAYADSGNKPRNESINNNNNNNNNNKGNTSSRPYSAGARASLGTRASASTGTRASSSTGTTASGGGSGAIVLAKPLTSAQTTTTVKKQGEEEAEAEEAMLTRRLHRLVDVMQREVEEEWCVRYQGAVKELDQKLGENKGQQW